MNNVVVLDSDLPIKRKDMETNLYTPRGPFPARYINDNLPPDSEEIKRKAASAGWYFIKGLWLQCPPYKKPNDAEYFGVDVGRAVDLVRLEETWQSAKSVKMQPVTHDGDSQTDDEPPIDGFGNILVSESDARMGFSPKSGRSHMVSSLSFLSGLCFLAGAFTASGIEAVLPFAVFGALFLCLSFYLYRIEL